jgi:hypothetical protein
MANINLSQSNAENGGKDVESIFDTRLVISLGIIILAFGTLFGLKMYGSSLEKETASLSANIDTQIKELAGDSSRRVIDFQERMKNIDEKLMNTSVSPQDMFVLMEQLVITGNSLDSYNYDVNGKAVTMKIVSNDFKSAAQQVMSFKSHSAFTSVNIVNSQKGIDGKVSSEVVISL